MKQAIVFTNWGDWEGDMVGAVLAATVPDEITREALVDIARQVCIKGTSETNTDLNEIEGALQVLTADEFNDITNEHQMTVWSEIGLHHHAIVRFEFSTEMLLALHIVGEV